VHVKASVEAWIWLLTDQSVGAMHRATIK